MWIPPPPVPCHQSTEHGSGGQPVETRKQENTPTCATPHPSGNFVSGTSAALTGNQPQSQPPAISRQLLVSQLPCASPELWSWAPPPLRFPRLHPSNSEGPRDGGHDCKTGQEAEPGPAGTGKLEGLRVGSASERVAFWVWNFSRPAPHSLRT